LGRSLQTTDAQGAIADGAEMVRQLRSAAERRGVTIRTGYRAARLVLNDQADVVGLEAIPAGIDPSSAASSPSAVPDRLLLGAGKAVLFASGGFSHDPAMVR